MMGSLAVRVGGAALPRDRAEAVLQPNILSYAKTSPDTGTGG